MKILRFISYIWALPNTLLGLILFFFIYGPKSLKWNKGVLEGTCKRMIPWWTNVVGQTWGWLVVYRSTPYLGLENHERQHVVQGMVLGPLFLVIYPIASLIALIQGKNGYRDNWFEKNADEHRKSGPTFKYLTP